MKHPGSIAIVILAAAGCVAWKPQPFLAAGGAILQNVEQITDRLTETLPPHPGRPLSQECI